METKFITINTLKIAYYEVNEPARETIFFVHGNSISKNCWLKQLRSDELGSYRLIAFDLPGHGDSDKAEVPDDVYSLKALSGYAVKIVEALSEDKPYIIAGLSLGTNIVSEMLAHKVHPSGILLAGSCIVGKEFTVASLVMPDTHVNVVFVEEADENDLMQYAGETSLSRDENDIEIFVCDYRKTDKRIRSKIAECIAKEDYSDELELINNKDITTLLVFGKNEQIINPGYLDKAPLPLWKKTVFKIDGASHLVNIDQPEAFNKLIADFAKDIFK